MKISFLKYYKNKETFQFAKRLGLDILEIQEPEKIDKVIDHLKEKHYDTIVMEDELASFSENMVYKYKNDNAINIIILPNSKRKT